MASLGGGGSWWGLVLRGWEWGSVVRRRDFAIKKKNKPPTLLLTTHRLETKRGTLSWWISVPYPINPE